MRARSRGSLAVLVAACAIAVILVGCRDDDHDEMVRSSTSTRAAARESRAIPRATIRTTTPITYDAKPVVADGVIWVVGTDGARRIDATSGALVGSLPTAHGFSKFADGAFWSLGTNPDRRCDGPEASWPSYSPYRVEKIDPQTGSIASGVDLPGTCRYESDNRDPYPSLVVGGGAAWVADPATCQVFRIDASQGRVSTFSNLAGELVSADAGGAWMVDANGSFAYSNPPCARRFGLTHVDQAGAPGPLIALPIPTAASGISIADGVAWVTAPRANGGGLALDRVDLGTGAARTTRVSPGSVGTGAAEVWFVGSFPAGVFTEEARTSRATNPGLLGEIDPTSGTVQRSFQLELGRAADPSATILAVSRDAVWIVANGPSRRILQVATRRTS